jgi:hypothetical protein
VRRRGLNVNVSRRRRLRRRRKLALPNNLANRTLAPLLHLATLLPLVRPNVYRSLRPPQRRSSTSLRRRMWSLPFLPYLDKTHNLDPLSSPTSRSLKPPLKRRTLPHRVTLLASTEPSRSTILWYLLGYRSVLDSSLTVSSLDLLFRSRDRALFWDLQRYRATSEHLGLIHLTPLVRSALLRSRVQAQ